MKLLFLVMVAQLRFDWQEPIILNVAPMPIQEVTITPNKLLIRDETNGGVHLFDRQGKRKATLGSGEPSIPAPFSVSWMEASKKIYIYDGSQGVFTTWDQDGNFLEKKGGPYDLFFQIGRLLPFENGYVAPISLSEDNHTLGHFNTDLIKNGEAYSLIQSELAGLNPELIKTFVIRVGRPGEPRFMAMQRFSKRVALFDENLKFMSSLHIDTNGWKDIRLKKLKKVANNPQELYKYRKDFSEIVALEALGNKMFIIGIRNLEDANQYTYQCYNADSGFASGPPMVSPYLLVGARGNELLFSDSLLESMTLFPAQIFNGSKVSTTTPGK